MTASRGALWRMAAAARSRWRLLAASVALGAGAVLAGVGLLAVSGYLISRAAQRPGHPRLGVAIAAVRGAGDRARRAALRRAPRLPRPRLPRRSPTCAGASSTRLVPLVPGGLPGVRGAATCSAASSPTSTACRTSICAPSAAGRRRDRRRAARACSSPSSWLPAAGAVLAAALLAAGSSSRA